MKNLNLKAVILLTACSISSIQINAQALNLTKYVDPFIGATGEGHTFPGASLPYGMVKIGPDCGQLNSNSGYDADGKVKGVSHVHVSGTGGPPKYGNILVAASTGKVDILNYGSYRSEESATPGYYAYRSKEYNLQAAYTVTHSVGFHKYRPEKNEKLNLIFDLGSFLAGGDNKKSGEYSQELVGSEVRIISDTEIEGYTRIRWGWNVGEAYTVYFYAVTDKPAQEFVTWKSGKLEKDKKAQYDSHEPVGAYLTFGGNSFGEVKMKVGISFLSVGKAKQNVKVELPGWDFEKVKQDASNIWNEKLNKVVVKTKNEDQKKIFYSSVYRTMLMPVNRTGENPKWKSDAPYYDDFYCIWDTFRATHPFLTLIQQKEQVEMINSLIDIYKQEGYMPDARSGNSTGRTQGGSNSDVLIADAFVKGLKGIDYKEALNSMIKNAEVPPGGDERLMGRGGINDYNNLGYVSTAYERAGSRTMEYAYNDYCIAIVAKGLGKDAIYEKYIKRAENWKNIWNKNIESDGAKGFIWPKRKDGTWSDKWNVHRSEGWSGWLYEGNSWEYSLYVPHDVASIVEKAGGNEAFVSRLDTFFNKNTQSFHPWLNDYYNVNNEPGFLTPTLYTYAGKSFKTNQTVRKIITKNYTSKPNGLPGNDDAGSMSAWYIFNTMGFFPVAGQNIYLITAPMFNEVNLSLSDGKKFKIVANKLSAKNLYIKSIRLNGVDLDRAWFRHEEIKDGGFMEIEMTNKPMNWDKVLPPSLSTNN